MRIAFITAGAAGMYCGSCMRDNALVTALRKLGHDALLLPAYMPIKVDEPDASQKKVFFGGINIYLEQKFRLFRHTPRFIDKLFNFRWLLKWVSRFAVRAKYSDQGALTVSMLQGAHGKQAKEVAELVEYLKDEKPDVVLFTNALLSGVIPAVKQALGVPVLVTLQGDDIFLDELPEKHRKRCFELIRENGRSVDAYVSTSAYYADHMAAYLGLPRESIHVVQPGINLAGHGGPIEVRTAEPLTVGFFARICPEKGFHRAVEAFIRMKRLPGAPAAKLKASGWLGENNRPYYDEQVKRLEAAGLLADFEHVESPTHDDKVRFMRSIDVLCVPTVYREPKGLYVLEAWANGVPVVLPAHGAFPELIELTGGGLLVAPDSIDELAEGLRRALTDHSFRYRAGLAGEAAVRDRFTADVMARETVALIERIARTDRPDTLRDDRMKSFSITRRVEFGDTDMAGIMHFSNFFRFMEVAESDFLRSLGLAVSWFEGGVKWGFPRVSAACDFQKPARFQDLLTIAVTVEKVGAKSVSYRHDFSNERGEPIAVGRITAVFCRSGPGGVESFEIPADVRAKLEAHRE